MGSAGLGLPGGCRGPPGLRGRLPGSGWGLPPCPALPMPAVSSPHACPSLHMCVHTCVHTHAHACSSVVVVPPPQCPGLGELLPRSQAAVPVSSAFLPPPPRHWQGSGCRSWQLAARAGNGMAQLTLARHGTARASGRSGLSRHRGQPVSRSGSELPLEPGGEQQRGEPHACAKPPMRRHTCVCPGHAHGVRAGHRCPSRGSAAPRTPRYVCEPCGDVRGVHARGG